MDQTPLEILEDRVLSYGLERAGFHQNGDQQKSKAVQRERFVAFYGVCYRTCSAIFEALKISRAEAGDVSNLLHFLVTMFWFKSYVTEPVLSGLFQLTENTVRKWIWEYARALQRLKPSKVWMMKTCNYYFTLFGI